MGYGDTGIYGSQHIHTPNIDRLALDGVRFTQAYAGSTVCAPSRSTLMTGTHAGVTPVRSNTGGVSLRPQDTTIAELLKEAGYATGGYGKWGLSETGQPGVPENKGFDEFFGYYHQIHAHKFYPDYLYHNSERVYLPGNVGFYDGPYGGDTDAGAIPSVNPLNGKKHQFSHYLIFDKMKQFIRDHHERPFFVYAPWTPPHSRYELPEDDPAWTKYENKPWPLSFRVHAAFISMIDRQVGEIISLLDELGIDDNTILFFTSDNGASLRLNQKPFFSNKPFRGGKSTLYEGGLRVPLIARWANNIEPDRTSERLTYFPDIFPTLAELAGMEHAVPDVVTGLSLLPELTGYDTADRKTEEHTYLYWEIADINWRELRYLNDESLQQAVRSGDWKGYRPGPGEDLKLFHLKNDIGEEHNVAELYPEIVTRLEEYLLEAHKPPPPQTEPERPEGRRYR